VHVIWLDSRDSSGNHEIYYKRNPTGNPIGISKLNTVIPDKFSLSQNYPNPFNPGTVISYSLLVNSFVSLKVYDAIGREVVTLVNEFQKTGTYETQFPITQ